MGEILTVGHSTHSWEEFVALLDGAGAELVADVRTHPGSRRLPHFNREAMTAALGDRYVHVPELGGRRRTRPDSPNGGWENASFRGYADHMATEEFAHGLERLQQLARERRAAIMCAEALWWRCHRRLVSDALLVRGWRVRHLTAAGSLSDHELTAFAHAEGTRLTYPPTQLSL